VTSISVSRTLEADVVAGGRRGSAEALGQLGSVFPRPPANNPRTISTIMAIVFCLSFGHPADMKVKKHFCSIW
jgi:hypothetical protein